MIKVIFKPTDTFVGMLSKLTDMGVDIDTRYAILKEFSLYEKQLELSGQRSDRKVSG